MIDRPKKTHHPPRSHWRFRSNPAGNGIARGRIHGSLGGIAEFAAGSVCRPGAGDRLHRTGPAGIRNEPKFDRALDWVRFDYFVVWGEPTGVSRMRQRPSFSVLYGYSSDQL